MAIKINGNTVISDSQAITTTSTISATGNITAGNVSVVGAVTASGINAGSSIISTTGNVTGGNVLTGGLISATATVTGGNLATGGTASATGNVTGGNVLTGGIVSATGNISGSYLLGNGSQITGLPAGYSNTNAASFLAAFGSNTISTTGTIASGNITGGNVLTGGLISATGNITGSYLLGNGSQITGLPAGYSNTNAASFLAAFGSNTISTTGTITSGNITGGNVLTGGLISATGNSTAANYLTGGIVSATGNIITGTNGYIGVGTATPDSKLAILGNTQTVSYPVTGNSTTTGTDLHITSQDGLQTRITQDAFGATVYSAFTGRTARGTAASPTQTLLGDTVSQFTGRGFSNGTLQFGNSSTGRIDIVAAENFTDASRATNVVVYTTATAATQPSAIAAFSSAAGLSVAGNVTSGNVLTAGIMSSTGNAVHGNVLTGGLISATGNVTGNFFVGNGLALTGISATTSYKIANGTSSVSIPAIGSNVVVTIGGDTVATFSTSVLDLTALSNYGITATGNVTGSNTVATTAVVAPTVRNTAALTISTSAGNLNLQPTGNIVVNSKYINGVSDPVQNQDVATKAYVDNFATTGIAFHTPVQAATNTTLAAATGGTITYTQPNGAANGVGALLTTTGSFNLIDTSNVQTVGTRILVKNEANAVTNGVYTWANATNIVRSTDTDEYGADSTTALSINDYFFTTAGNVNAGAAFVVNAPTGTITFGTSSITFTTFSTSQVYSANTSAGISLTGTVISAKVDGTTTAFDGSGNISVKASAVLTTPNIGAATGTTLSTTGTVTGGNLATGGTASATGNVTGGNVLTGGLISATATVTGGNLATGGTASATGNVTGGNVLTGGLISATATVTGGNLATGGTASATGNVTGGNVLTGGLISATGNVTGGNITGNILSGTTATVTGNINVGNVNATNHTGTTVSITGTVTAASVVGGVITGSSASVTGTVTGASVVGGVITGSSVSVTGNITGGNVLGGANVNATTHTGTTVSVTGTVTAASVVGGVITGSSTSVTGTVTAASVVGGVITGSSTSVTGTVTGGNITTAGQLTVNSGANVTAIVNGATNGVGNIGSSTVGFNTVFAKATTAQYADLAEKYTADAAYAPGTVLVFGGTAEVTADAADADRRVAGVVSTNPGLLMNEGLDSKFAVAIALTGRVPTSVVGTVRKGDMMVAAGSGQARAEAEPAVGTVIGKALEDFDGAEGTIEVVVGRF